MGCRRYGNSPWSWDSDRPARLRRDRRESAGRTSSGRGGADRACSPPHPRRRSGRRRSRIQLPFPQRSTRVALGSLASDSRDTNADKRTARDAAHQALSALAAAALRSEEHTSELQSLMRISYAVFCLKKKKPISRKHLRQI